MESHAAVIGSQSCKLLSSMGIRGNLSSEIGELSDLSTLDLSSNNGLGGPLPATIGNLKQLTTLVLLDCHFSGNIPSQLGSATQLSFLALNSNQFTGSIPSSLGLLAKLSWLDISDNQLTGQIPVSDATTGAPGLDMLVNCQHFHFYDNQLSGFINETLFSSKMSLIHVLFQNNQLIGQIPGSVSLLNTLVILRLDNNQLSGSIPAGIGSLKNLQLLRLSYNQLSGLIPDLSALVNLNYLDLSQNSFTAQAPPAWLSSLASLTSLMLSSLGLTGSVPNQLFALPQMEQVILSNNKFTGTLVLNSSISSVLQTIDVQNNSISSVSVSLQNKILLKLAGNAACNNSANANYCSLQQTVPTPYATSLAQCASTTCSSSDQSVDPLNCACEYPFQGQMVFFASTLTDVSNASLFKQLEAGLAGAVGLVPGSVAISDVNLTGNSLTLKVKFFSSSGPYFNWTYISELAFVLDNQVYTAPSVFGPYHFTAVIYPGQGSSSGKTTTTVGASVIAGIVVGVIILLLCLAVLAVYARRQRLRAQEAIDRISGNPFASWGMDPAKGGSVPHLSGLRLITFEELRKCTNNFDDSHEIGAGGYGKVYKGVLLDGQVVAIKRAQTGSMQGAAEFKNEIELLSRVHHRNLVKLIGFCYEQREQLLVYEYISNGTLRENLIRRGGVHLSWKRRLLIAHDSARGLAYLHELADPPIIHRDVKSTNILLDEHFIAKVADFGLSKLVSDPEKGHVSTQVKGTLGYLDPEYYMTQQLSEKSDVYSFGVVMLELISARLPIEHGKYIVREVRMAIDQQDQEFYGLEGILDPAIQESAKSVGFRRFVQLSLECADESAANRPTMNEVVREIEIIMQNEGVETAAFSALELAGAAGGHHRHDDEMPLYTGSGSSSAFAYSSQPSFLKVDPK